MPQQYTDVIGEMANIFETESDGKRAFLIVTDQAMPKGDSVLRQSEEVLKHAEKTDANARLSALESEISELKSLLISNVSSSLHKNENQWARPDSKRRPPPCEGGGFSVQRSAFWISVSTFLRGCAARPDNN